MAKYQVLPRAKFERAPTELHLPRVAVSVCLMDMLQKCERVDNRRLARAVWPEDQGDRFDRNVLGGLEGLEVFEGDSCEHGAVPRGSDSKV